MPDASLMNEEKIFFYGSRSSKKNYVHNRSQPKKSLPIPDILTPTR